MTEETVFTAALEKSSPAQRAAYLDEACAGDQALRERVEALLRSHTEAGGFLETPAVERAVEELRGPAATPADPPGGEEGGHSLDFLAPSEKPGSLGRLGHYEVLEIIGHGGMGVVLRAFDERLHRIVAVKVLAPQLATSAVARSRFVREAQAAAAIRNEHVVDIHAVEEVNGLPFLAMEYVDGVSLQQRLNRGGPLELREVLRIGMQAAAGLAAAHGQGLIHRDVKPSNILLENGVERVKIGDFGLARAVDDASLTQSGIIAGTPQYMAPEQARGQPVDHRSDLFSLGSVLYAMCTGRAPFRADSTMAVLKRVCDDAPRPIQDLYPETPDWLIAIIARLHAKDPAERFQSAAEVAELLGQHLAHVQQPALAPLPAMTLLPSPLGRGGGGEGRHSLPSPLAGEGSGVRGRRRWAIAAAMLLLLIGGLSATEATGVTQVMPTVIRIVTGEGTLVVEVDDPGIEVTIEGDGGLVITGAGPQEIRLRPGSYQVRATRDGRPVQEELVTIARGGKQVVRVRLESKAPAAAATAAAEPQAFVLLGGEGVADRKFDTLADAVQGASDGDTIEVRGNGPFVSQPIDIRGTALTIRAAPGFRPVIRLNAERETGPFFLLSYAPLVLEGLELQRDAQDSPNEAHWRAIVHSVNAPLYAANCRFLLKGLHTCIHLSPSPILELRNCEFLCTDGTAFGGECFAGQRWGIENCVQAGGGCGFSLVKADLNKVTIRMVRNTMIVRSIAFTTNLFPEASALLTGRPEPPCRVEASGNVFDTLRSHMNFEQSQPKPLPAAEAEAALRRILAWQGRGNLYAIDQAFLSLSVQWRWLEPATPVKSLADWRQFWGTDEADSIEGRARYVGGDLLARLRAAPEVLTPEDFRLRPDSAGYRAGADGKDLGADVDLVGPGAAYERWKQTPEYQQWLKDTGQAEQ